MPETPIPGMSALKDRQGNAVLNALYVDYPIIIVAPHADPIVPPAELQRFGPRVRDRTTPPDPFSTGGFNNNFDTGTRHIAIGAANQFMNGQKSFFQHLANQQFNLKPTSGQAADEPDGVNFISGVLYGATNPFHLPVARPRPAYPGVVAPNIGRLNAVHMEMALSIRDDSSLDEDARIAYREQTGSRIAEAILAFCTTIISNTKELRNDSNPNPTRSHGGQEPPASNMVIGRLCGDWHNSFDCWRNAMRSG